MERNNDEIFKAVYYLKYSFTVYEMIFQAVNSHDSAYFV